jgi:hypothetical protein
MTKDYVIFVIESNVFGDGDGDGNGNGNGNGNDNGHEL